MPATREQLEARWETPEGRQVAEKICTLLETGVPLKGGQAQEHRTSLDVRMRAQWPGFPLETEQDTRRAVTIEELQQMITFLPFREEVAPALDLRGLHLKQKSVKLLQDLDLSGAHLEYLEIGSVGASRMVETILDHCRSVNALFIADFTSASFVQTRLPGVKFLEATLAGANFTQAKLALAEFRERDCRNASFREADLRFVDARHADLRGANLAGADLTEANLAGADLTGIQFNEQTRVQGTNLYRARLDEPFRTFAEQSGGLLEEDQEPSFKEQERAELGAVIRLLKEENEDGRLDMAIACLEELAQHFAPDPEHSWSMKAEKALSPELMQEVMERYAQVSRALAFYL